MTSIDESSPVKNPITHQEAALPNFVSRAGKAATAALVGGVLLSGAPVTVPLIAGVTVFGLGTAAVFGAVDKIFKENNPASSSSPPEIWYDAKEDSVLATPDKEYFTGDGNEKIETKGIEGLAPKFLGHSPPSPPELITPPPPEPVTPPPPEPVTPSSLDPVTSPPLNDTSAKPKSSPPSRTWFGFFFGWISSIPPIRSWTIWRWG